MKIRSIVIVLVFLSLSVTANAVTIFDKQGTTLELNGDLQVQYRQKIGVDEEPYVDYDDLEVGFHASHELYNGWTGFGVLIMDWKGQAHGDNDNAVDEAYVGLGFGPGSFRFGRMYYGSDDFPVEKAYEMDMGTAIPATDGDESVRLDAQMGPFNAIFSADLGIDEGSGTKNESLAEAYVYLDDLFDGNIGVFYQTYKADEDADSVDTVGIRGEYELGPVSLAADYTTNDDKDVANCAVGFPIIKNTSGAIGYGLESPDQGDDIKGWYANVVHKFSSSVRIFAEIGDNDKEDTDMGYLAGMRVKF